jgi:hypothetical protein
MAAFDAETGRRIWRFDVTAPDWEELPEHHRTVPHRDLAAERAQRQYAGAWNYGRVDLHHSVMMPSATS